ncbi:MAG: acyltransferase family protein [Notoacmeibacter sp.]|nr:acyltransferase family protein [Notoacmeibacter sp.]
MNRRLHSLDGLRGMAAWLVVISHVSNESGLWGKLLGNGAGQVGVILFFSLSGFLMGYLYSEMDWNTENVWNFAIARVARVVPLFFIIVLFCFIFSTYFNSTILSRNIAFYAINKDNLFDNILFVKGTSILWTVPVEIKFYIFFVFYGSWLRLTASRTSLYWF